MALKKDFKFEPTLITLAQFHFAFSHPARMKIMEILQQFGAVNFHVLAREIPLSPATVSQHIAILRRVGLIVPVELSDRSAGYQIQQDTYQDLQHRAYDFLL